MMKELVVAVKARKVFALAGNPELQEPQASAFSMSECF